MALRLEKAEGIGFCFGVKRAIDILERVARERGGIETLGPVVHNQQVMQKLGEIGVRVAQNVSDMRGNVVAISSHGVSPRVEEEIRAQHIDIIDTTCPFVHRVQIAARRLVKSGFFVIIYGDAEHSEVKSVLGWAEGNGMATTDEKVIASLDHMPRRLGLLAQTTQIPAYFAEFAKKLIDVAFTKDSEMRFIDTICHDIIHRQATALELANKADLMLVVGSHTSANTNRLVELCSAATRTYLVETAADIHPFWFQGRRHIGIAAGASTAIETVNEVIAKLEAMDCSDSKPEQ